MKKKNLGFTLAEVLIVIGIIGVVAALTLPNLNHATGDKEKVTKVKKIYSTLTEAVDRAQAIYGPFDTWFKDLQGSNGDIENWEMANERFAKRVTEFLKVSKDCGFENGCWSENELLLSNGESVGDNGSSGYSIVLSDNISLNFCRGGNGPRVRVDIDGPQKGKKQMGNDIFDYSIYINEKYKTRAGIETNYLYPSAWPNRWTGYLVESEGYMGSYSTAWVIENGNLDYLKCPEELNWETKTSCE